MAAFIHINVFMNWCMHERTLMYVCTCKYNCAFIHSFIQAIFTAPLQVHYYSEALSTTARILCRSFTPKRHRQLRVKDLPKVPTWRLERDSNPRPSGRKASTLPMRHHVPRPELHTCMCVCIVYTLYVSVCLPETIHLVHSTVILTKNPPSQ